MRLGLEKALSLEGYRVASAATGAEARRRARAERFDCAFVDLKLPDPAARSSSPTCRRPAPPWSSSPRMPPWTRRCAR